MLLRHGEAQSNKEKTFAGWADVPLTPLGIEQAELLSKRLYREKFDHAYCSDLLRCRETLRLSKVKAPATFARELREKNYGQVEGINWEEHPEYHEQHTNPFNTAPGGESALGVQQRVVDYFENEITKSGFERVLLVSHHGPIVLLSCHLLHIPIEYWRSLRMGNAGLSQFDWEEGQLRLTLWNSLSHFGMITNRGLFREKK